MLYAWTDECRQRLASVWFGSRLQSVIVDGLQISQDVCAHVNGSVRRLELLMIHLLLMAKVKDQCRGLAYMQAPKLRAGLRQCQRST